MRPLNALKAQATALKPRPITVKPIVYSLYKKTPNRIKVLPKTIKINAA